MRRIGLLGGMSWESTIEYYRLLNQGVRTRLGGLHSAELITISFDFDFIERLQAAAEWQRAGELLAEATGQLGTAGADLVPLCSNTMHKCAEDASAPRTTERGIRRVGLLAESRRAYREVIDRLVDCGAEGIVLGCTEVELLITHEDSPVPVFPTTRLHVEAALDAALGETAPASPTNAS